MFPLQKYRTQKHVQTRKDAEHSTVDERLRTLSTLEERSYIGARRLRIGFGA